MPFKIGISGNPAGRPKTIRNHQDEIRVMLFNFIKAHFSEVLSDMDTLSTKDRMRFFCQLLKHSQPKYMERRSEIDWGPVIGAEEYNGQ